jgi:hypothetical protein
VELEGDSKDEIEYMEFDATTKRFGFHVIDTANHTVRKNAPTCNSCHFGRPNWDAYDNWAGALPYNRDRIYQDSHEAAAMMRLLKDLRDDPVVKHLELPNGIGRDANGDVTIAFNTRTDPGDRDAAGNPVGVDIPYGADADGNLTFPGNTGKVNVVRGGPYLLMKHPVPIDLDEGRGVSLFDQLTKLNAQRIAQDLIATPRDAIDVRPVALAIAKGCTTAANLTDYATAPALQALVAFHGMNVDALLADTRKRQEGLPQTKANLQAINVRALVTQMTGDPNPVPEFILSDVFRRSIEPGFVADTRTGFMVDRERYTDTPMIALFRFVLEPLKVRVDTWSMSVRSTSSQGRSKTYTFADVFDVYTSKIIEVLGNETLSNVSGSDAAPGKDKTCGDLATDSKDWFTKAYGG